MKSNARSIGKKSTHKQKLGVTRTLGNRTMKIGKAGFPKKVGYN